MKLPTWKRMVSKASHGNYEVTLHFETLKEMQDTRATLSKLVHMRTLLSEAQAELLVTADFSKTSGIAKNRAADICLEIDKALGEQQ